MHCQNSNLLQHDIVHNGVRMPWGEGFRQWGVLLGKTANLVWEKGILTVTRVNELRADQKGMGAPHRALGLSINLWPHLWVDHMVEMAGLHGDLSLTAGVQSRGETQAVEAGGLKQVFQRGREGEQAQRGAQELG